MSSFPVDKLMVLFISRNPKTKDSSRSYFLLFLLLKWHQECYFSTQKTMDSTLISELLITFRYSTIYPTFGMLGVRLNGIKVSLFISATPRTIGQFRLFYVTPFYLHPLSVLEIFHAQYYFPDASHMSSKYD